MDDTYPVGVQLHKLRAFAAVAEHGNVRRAALAIHLSQPAVTRAVQQLECALGAPLFERTTRGMATTAAGLYMVRRVERALGELRLAASAMHEPGVRESQAERRPGRLFTAVTEGMLAALLAVARGGSESAAAALIGLSQPALHRSLHRLEQLAETELFLRSARGTRLTRAGEVLLRHAKLALAEIRVGAEEIASMQGRLNGRLVIGALPLSSGHLVPQAVDRTLQDHPALRVSIIDGTYETLSYGLRCAEVDVIVGALRTNEDEPYALHEPLFDDSLSVVARADHPVLRLGNLHSLTRLVGESWIMPLAGTPSRAAFERAFRAEGIEPPNAPIEGNSPSIVRALLLSSERLALLSERQVRQELRQGILTIVPVPVRQTRRPIGLAMLRSSEPSPALAAFVAALRIAARRG